MKTKKGNRMLAGILCLCLLLSTMPLAGVSLEKGDSCHQAHDEACGYVQAVEGRECGHKHGDDCGAAGENGQYANCAHKHNDECGYKPAVAGKDCMHVHGDACSKETTAVTKAVETKDKKSSGTAGTTTGTTTSTTTGTTKAAEEKKESSLSAATTAVTQAAAKLGEFGRSGEQPGNDKVKTITGWSFVGGDNITKGELAMAGVSAGNQASLEAVVSMLPKKISAKIGEGTEEVLISWSCPTFVQTKGSWPITGEHIFTAALPAGYTCDTLPTVKVILGGAQTLNEIKGDGYSFNTQTGKLTITSNAGTINWRADANIAADGDARYNAIKSVVINQGVTRIEREAFRYCENLEGASLPSGLEYIGNDAFRKCIKLTGIVFPDSVTYIGEGAFGESGLKGRLQLPTSLTEIRANSFIYCKGLTGVNFPAGLTHIRKGAFSGCTGITIITLPSKLEEIGSGGFRDCDGLRTVVFESAAAPTLGKGAFTGVHSDFAIYTPKNAKGYEGADWSAYKVQEIGEYHPEDVGVINNIIDNNGLAATKDDEKSWNFVSWTEAAPKRIETMNWGAKSPDLTGALDLTGLSEATNLYISSNTKLTSVNVSGLTKLKNLYVSDNGITAANITGCTALEDLNIYNNKLKSLDVSGLSNISSLRCQNNGLEYLNISGLNKLTNFEGSGNSLTTLVNQDGNKVTVNKAQKGTTSIYGFNLDTNEISISAVPDNNHYFSRWIKNGGGNVDGGELSLVLDRDVEVEAEFSTKPGNGYSFDDVTGLLTVTTNEGTLNWQTEGVITDGNQIKAVEIKPGVTQIGRSAFWECSNLNRVAFADSVKRIGNQSFARTDVTGQLKLPSNLEHIGEYAFMDSKITGELVLPSTLKTLGRSAFERCGEITRVIIAGEIEKLEVSAFSACTKLTSVTFPRGLKSFYSRVFDRCTSLNTLHFLGDTAPTIADGEIDTFLKVEKTGTIYYPAGGQGYTDAWKNDNLELDDWTLASAYRLTVNNGTDETKSGLYNSGDSAVIKADEPEAGKVFDSWTGGDDSIFEGNGRISAETTITMPAGHVTVTATYKDVLKPDPDPDNPNPDPNPDNPDPDNPDPDKPTPDPDKPGTDPDDPNKPVDPNHKHTYGGDWLQDEGYHWQLCTGGDGETGNRAEHTFGRWVKEKDGCYADCTVCGYRRTESTRPVIPGYEDRYIADSHTGVKVRGYFSQDAKLEIKKGELHSAGECGACDGIRDRQNKGELIVLYDISLVSGSYTGDVTVEIPVGKEYNGQVVTILHCKDNVVESRTLTVKDGVARGTFTSLSPFAVVKATEEEKAQAIANGDVSPKTGDSALMWLWIASMLAAAAIGAVALRKKVKN